MIIPVDTKYYYVLLRDLTLCKNKNDLMNIEVRINDICNKEIEHSNQSADIRNTTFTILIEKISNMYSFKLKMFSDEHSQNVLNRWTFLLAIGTFLMVIISFISIICK